MAKKKKSKRKFHAGQTSKKKKQHIKSSSMTAEVAQSNQPNEQLTGKNQPIETSEKNVQSSEKAKSVKSGKTLKINTSGHEYVKKDLRRSFVTSGIIIGMLIILWLIFQYTPLGPAIYHLVKI